MKQLLITILVLCFLHGKKPVRLVFQRMEQYLHFNWICSQDMHMNCCLQEEILNQSATVI